MDLNNNTYHECLRDLVEMKVVLELLKNQRDEQKISISEYNRIKQEHDETMELISNRLSEVMNQ